MRTTRYPNSLGTAHTPGEEDSGWSSWSLRSSSTSALRAAPLPSLRPSHGRVLRSASTLPDSCEEGGGSSHAASSDGSWITHSPGIPWDGRAPLPSPTSPRRRRAGPGTRAATIGVPVIRIMLRGGATGRGARFRPSSWACGSRSPRRPARAAARRCGGAGCTWPCARRGRARPS